MRQGDFSTLAKAYRNRPGYSELVLTLLLSYVRTVHDEDLKIADVGAGTGKLTENLVALGLSCVAIEPNTAMREEGIAGTHGMAITWKSGSAEDTGLEDNSIHWLLMGSSFHWVDLEVALSEFYRVLKPGGFFTALWNPRDIERSELHSRIERRIHEIVPELKRVSSGGSQSASEMYTKLVSTGHFTQPFLCEAPHEVLMTPDRYMGAWRSVNDIQAQAGPERFQHILAMIETEIRNLSEIKVPYKTRAWTVRVNK